MFPSSKMAAILNFRIFSKNGKTQMSFYLLNRARYTVRDRAISSKFSTHRVSKECNLYNFQKKFSLPKNGGHFEFLPKMAKHKFPSISLTVRDRAISSKFSTHRVSKQCTFCNFQKMFPSSKMAAILNFRIFAKNGKTQICFYLLNRAR